MKRYVKDSYYEKETEADSDNDSVVQDDCLDATLKANRLIPVPAAPTVPNKEDDVRRNHGTSGLSAFDTMGESGKERGKKEHNLLANKKIINVIIKLNQTTLAFSLPKKRINLTHHQFQFVALYRI